ncbi:MAG: polyketide synthase dehydratase domain-containing protein [Thermoguttaceae bacterium]|nr:polyketide synthase dehydratase domain-containing protein [Thermoguttaceae bacterium]
MSYPHEPLAIIGAHCCVPGAFSPEEFWNNLSQGKISITTIPDPRYPFDIYKAEHPGTWGKSHTNLAGIVDFKKFNQEILPGFYQTLSEAGYDVDTLPTGTGVLFASYTAYMAIKSSGYNPFQLPQVPINVFTGMVRLSDGYTYYQLLSCLPWLEQTLKDAFPEFSDKELDTIWSDFGEYWKGNSQRLQPYFSHEKGIPHQTSRCIQQLFKLNGTGFTFDNACSTSLAAFYLAEHFLTLHPEGMALCGGFNFVSKSNVNLFSYNQASSKERSRPFDEQADGLIPGEGCSYLLVRPLSAALKAGNNILGLVRGVGVSCDGKGKGLWAPSSKGQSLAVSRAWEDAKLDKSESPDYFEAHATSTRLGDATELEAVDKFLKDNNFTKPTPITSVKANLGHMLEAAGATSAIKVLQSLRHQVILPQPSLDELTTKFDWENSPLYVQREVKSWPINKDKKRLAVVEAFGIGGLNASIVLEGPESVQKAEEERRCTPNANKPIAVVGIGCIAPEAYNAKEYRNKIKLGKCVMSPAPDDRNDLFLTREEFQELAKRGIKAGFIKDYHYDWKRPNIPPKQIALGHALQFWFLGAVDQAIDDAGLPRNIKESEAHPERWNRCKTAIVAGSKSGTDFACSTSPANLISDMQYSMKNSLSKMGYDSDKIDSVVNGFQDAILQKFRFNEDQTGGFTISTLGSRISKSYDINGPAFSLDGGYSASFTGLATAYNILQDDRLDYVFCVSGDRAQGGRLRALVRGATDVTPPSECAVAFVLKRAEDALANGDKIYAIISNIEVDSSGVHVNEGYSKVSKTTLRSSTSAETTDIDDSLTKIFGDFGPAKGMMAFTNVMLDIQEQNQTAPASWQIQQTDCEGILINVDFENVAAYRERCEKREAQKAIVETVESKPEDSAQPSIQMRSTQDIASRTGNFSLRRPGNRVAFLFAGQGAQYPNMMSGLTELPAAREIIEDLDDFLATVGLPNFETVLQTEGVKLGKDTFRTQLSLLIADTFIHRLYASQGIQPDVVMGHSYGEYPAMTAAGVWSFQAAALATQKRCQAIESALAEFTANRTRTAMLSTNASEDQIQDGMATIPDAATTIFISNRNAPTQTIISGTYDSIKKMEAYLLSCQRLALILPVPAAFHSPLMSGVCKPFAEALKPFKFDLSTGRLLSSVTSAFESDPDVFRNNLVEQMTKPVDFITMIRKAYNVGCRHFVEIGPKKILTNLAKQILSDCSDVSFYISDNSKGGDPEKFLEVCAQLRNLQGKQDSTEKLVVETRTEKEESINERKETASLQSASQSSSLASNYSISICRQSGTPYEMGLQYGKQYAQELRATIRRYVDVVGQATEKLLPPEPAMDKESLTTRFGEDGLEEMRGIAEGAGIPLEALIRHNVCLFPTLDTSEQRKLYNAGRTIPTNTNKQNLQTVENIASGCVQFAGTTPNGTFIHGCNIDLPFKRIVPDSVQIQVQVRKPNNGISHCFVGITGMRGTIGGINSKGLCVTSCTLLDYPTPFQVKPESMEHSTLIEKILSECSNIDQALKVIYKNGSIGGWTIGLTEGGTGSIAQVEYCDKLVVHRDAMDFLAQANHSQLLVNQRPERSVEVPEHSRIREARLRQILTNDGAEKTLAVDALTAFAALRDVKLPNQNEKPQPGAFRTIGMLHRVDNVCSWMFNHTAQMLIVASTPDVYVSEDDKALWNEIPIRDLLPDYDARVSSAPQVVESAKSDVETSSEPKAETTKSHTASEILKLTPAQLYDKINKEMSGIEKTITGRYIECLVEAPELSSDLPKISGRTLIIASDTNPVAIELLRQLSSDSNDAVIYDLCDNNAGKSEDVIVSEIDALWKENPVRNIFVVPSWNSEETYKFNCSDWRQIENKVIIPLYLTLRQIYRCANAQKEVDKLRLVAGVRLGGDGGFAGYSDRVEGGAIAGLIRNLHIENMATFHARNTFKNVDFPLNAKYSVVANALIKELQSSDWQPDVCYQANKRYFLTIVPDVISSETLAAAPAPKSGEVWLVTGGARGVTAELAYHLAKKRNAKLYILGSSQLPKIDPSWRGLDADGLKQLKQTVVRAALAEKKKPASEWSRVEKALEIDKNLHRLDEANISWNYMACDLSSYENASKAISQILRQEGHISGVLHGAGFEKSATFYKKEERFVRMTVDIKVGSLWAILETLEQNLPEYIVMMGSAAGRLGGNGQSDYGMSNYISSKMLNRYSAIHPQCRAYTVHWNAWDEVGMSVRPESLFAFKSMGMAMMPVKEGCDHFYSELIIDNYQPELSPLPYKLYQDVNVKDLEKSGVTPDQGRVSQDDNTASKTAETVENTSFDMIFGSNADAYELRKKLRELNIELTLPQSSPVLMVCRDEQLSRLMNKAQINVRVQSTQQAALNWVEACKRGGATKVVVPTADSVDPITQEFIESVKAILPVEQISIPWTTEPSQTAEIILKVLQGGKPESTSSSKADKMALVNKVCLLTPDAIETECIIDPVKDVFLQQHQLMGTPLLPIVMGLELIAETACVLSEKNGLGRLHAITDVSVVRGVSCTQTNPYRLVCRMDKTETPNVWNVLVKGDFYNKNGKKINENCPYYRCKVIFGDDPEGKKNDLIEKRSPLDYGFNVIYLPYGSLSIYHGPALQCLKSYRFNDKSYLLGNIIPQENVNLFGDRTDGNIVTKPALMDASLYACGILSWLNKDNTVTVPECFGRIEYGSGQVTPGQKCECCVVFKGFVQLHGGYNQVVFDYTLYNEHGECIVNVKDYRATIVAGQVEENAAQNAAQPKAEPKVEPSVPDDKNQSPALVNRICTLTENSVEVECIVDPMNDVFLQQHQINKTPVLPFVIGVELIAETAQILTKKLGLEPLSSLQNFKILRGVICTQSKPYRLVCQISKDKSNNWVAFIKGDLYNKEGKLTNQNCPYYRCEVKFGNRSQNGIAGKVVAAVPKNSLSNVTQAKYPEFGEAPLYQGPVLQRLDKCRYNDGKYLLGELNPQANSLMLKPHEGSNITNSAVLDATLYSCAILHQVTENRGSVIPDQFDSIEFGAGLVTAGVSCYCCAEFVNAITLPGGYEQKVFNVTLYNEKNEVVLNIVKYQATIAK